MDGETITWIFLIAGLLAMLVETIVPGGIAFILGFSSVIVAGLRYLGLLQEPLTAGLAWVGLSIAMTLAIRPLIAKFWAGETSFKYADEDYEAMDKIVKVVEPVSPDDNKGRIRYQGISWQARSNEGRIPAGKRVRIKYRDNVTWIVEPYDTLDLPDMDTRNQLES